MRKPKGTLEDSEPYNPDGEFFPTISPRKLEITVRTLDLCMLRQAPHLMSSPRQHLQVLSAQQLPRAQNERTGVGGSCP